MAKQRVKKQQKKVVRKQAELVAKASARAKAPAAAEGALHSVSALHDSLTEAAASTEAKSTATKRITQVKSNKKRRNVGAEEVGQLNAVLQDASFRKDPTGAIRQHLTALREIERQKAKGRAGKIA